MKQSCSLTVDCANCANLMEAAIRQIPGISSATVQFIQQKLTFEYDDSLPLTQIQKAITSACQKIEPDCELNW